MNLKPLNRWTRSRLLPNLDTRNGWPSHAVEEDEVYTILFVIFPKEIANYIMQWVVPWGDIFRVSSIPFMPYEYMRKYKEDIYQANYEAYAQQGNLTPYESMQTYKEGAAHERWINFHRRIIFQENQNNYRLPPVTSVQFV